MNIEEVIRWFVLAIMLLLAVCSLTVIYQEWKKGKQRSKHNHIIQLWKNTEPRIQVSGKKYLEMLDNL